MNRPALLKRFPHVRSSIPSTPVLPADVKVRYPALARDVETLEDVVGPVFAEADRDALSYQNIHRRQQVVMILGAVLLSGLGALQAALSTQNWPGIALGVLGLVLAGVGRGSGELRTFQRFLDERVKAERLRAMHFRYLSHTGRYATEERETVLRYAVISVKNGEEPR